MQVPEERWKFHLSRTQRQALRFPEIRDQDFADGVTLKELDRLISWTVLGFDELYEG